MHSDGDGERVTFLLVDDEPNVTTALRRILRPHQVQILVAQNGVEALGLLEAHPVDVVVTDMRMPVMNGADLLREVTARWPHVVRILLTGFADLSLTSLALRSGWTDHFLTKPWEPEHIELTFMRAIRARRAER